MGKHKKQDIIDHIVDRLRSADEPPYREGAWEQFQAQHGVTDRRKSRAYYWAASAAAILLVGAFAVKQFVFIDPIQQDQIVQQAPIETEQPVQMEVPSSDGLSIEPTESLMDAKSVGVLAQGYSNRIENGSSNTSTVGVPFSFKSFGVIGTGSQLSASLSSVALPHKLKGKNYQIATLKLDTETSPAISDNPANTGYTLAQNANTMGNSAVQGQEPILQNRKFNFREKFDLGFFVSPNSTNEKVNIGGGLLLAYNLSKNLSVRTGLTYNQYAVASMRDPLANQDVAVSASRDVIMKNSSTANGFLQSAYSNAVILPNVNAVTGTVQAIEVPLDLKFKSKSGYYASSGLTYAAVVNQQRFAHYIENNNQEMFPNGLPDNPKDLESAAQQVSKAIKTEEQNVKTNSFGGFVNFSIGKEMKMNKNLSISVEPFMKLPVGSFKQADMNYTNGGIRIITNF